MRRSCGWWRTGLGILAAAAFSAGAYWSLRLAYADHLRRKPDGEAVRRAIGISPGDARAYRRWAALEPGESVPALRAAVARNPRDSSAWIELGLEAERRGDLPMAEKCLLEAAQVDRTLGPRWSLANYYFRRDRTEQFWRWAREAAAVTPRGSAAPLLRLCWGVAPDPGQLLSRVVEYQPHLLPQFLQFLLAEGQLEGAQKVAHRLLDDANPEALAALLACCDRLLQAGRVEVALGVWNGLAVRGLIPFRALAPDQGMVLTDGGFSGPHLERGFAWRFPRVSGVVRTSTGSPPAMRFTFSGRQPESCVLASQFVPLRAGQHYRLSFRYRTAGIAAGSGPQWRIAGAGSAPSSSEDWKEESFDLTAPEGAEPARLALLYRRVPGTTRIEGRLWISQVKLEPRPTS